MKETANNIGANETEEQKDSLQLSDIINWALHHKWFFAISVTVCMAAGIYYAAKSQPIYQRSASVMLRSDASGQAQISELAAFADLGIGSNGLDVYNELQAFQSPTLMLDVVNRLGINVSYKSKNWLGRITDWYDKTPLTAEFGNLPETVDGKALRSFSFKVEKTDGGKLAVSDFVINGLKYETPKLTVSPGSGFKTPVGVITLKATGFYGKNLEDGLTVGYTAPEVAAKGFSKRLAVELADKFSTVINFSYSDSSAKRAEDVLNTLLDAYNEEWIRYTNKSTVNTAKFIGERLAVIEQELGAVDSDIERFKSGNRLLDISAETAQVTAESSKYAEQAFVANNQLAVARFIQEYLTDKTKNYDLLPANSGIGSPTIEAQIAEYNKKLLERQRLANGSSDNNPLVADLNGQLQMMRSTILRSIENHISTLKIQSDRLAAQENAIAGRISAGPGKAKELLTIERQQKIKEQLYLYLLQKREENELQASIVVNNTRLLKPATGEDAPVSPKKSMIYAAAFILGLAIPFGYMFAANTLNTKVRTRDDLNTLSAPILGEIPFVPPADKPSLLKRIAQRNKKEDRLPAIVVKDHNRNAVNEAFRVARTNLDFMIGNRKGTETIMITSFFAGSGKSFTTLNLAAVMALKDKKVAVIDLDIRKGTFSKLIGSPKNGVSTYLNGQCGLDEIIVRGQFGFDTLPAGQLPPNPAELLLSERLDTMAAELRNRYDYIFIDCPPTMLVTDTSLVSRIADRTLFVVRAGLMDRRMLPEVEKIYQEGHYKNMSVLLNGSHTNSTYSRYGYGYGYGYGGGYLYE